MTPFFWKRCFFDMVEKLGFTNCVFEKLCFVFWKHFLYSVSAKHSFSKTKTVCWKKNRKFMKNSGLFLNMAKWCFLGLFFSGFHVIVVCFWCVWHSSKSVQTCLFFFQFWGAFVGWLILAYLGLEGLGVFVFLVFVFLFCVAFVSVLFALFCFVVGLFWVLVLVLFCF